MKCGTIIYVVTPAQGVGSENGCWKLSHINKYYEKCDSYPSIVGIECPNYADFTSLMYMQLAVPSDCDNTLIEAVCKFRSRGRFPVITNILLI